jgi:hypothetical protein
MENIQKHNICNNREDCKIYMEIEWSVNIYKPVISEIYSVCQCSYHIGNSIPLNHGLLHFLKLWLNVSMLFSGLLKNDHYPPLMSVGE